MLHPQGCSWGAFKHGLGKTWLGLAWRGAILHPAGAWTPAEGSSPSSMVSRLSCQCINMEGACFGDAGGSGSRRRQGRGLVQMAGGAQGKGGDMKGKGGTGSPAGSSWCGQTPVSRVGQSRQWFCRCRREGGKLWAGGTE